MHTRLKAIPLAFWKTSPGREPVREWLKQMPPSDRAVIGRDLRRLQFGWPVGMPLVHPLGDGLWELRSSLSNRREVRFLFAAGDDMIIVFQGLIKKSQKTPAAEITLARKRMKELIE